MSKRVVLILAVFFVFTLAFYASVTRQSSEGAKVVLTSLGDKTLREANKIEIYQGEKRKGFKLLKEGEHWVIISDFRKPAKEGTVQEFLETFADLSGEERAQGQKYFSRFGVDEKNGLHIVFEKDGEVLSHFIVGKRGPWWESSFVRLEGGKKIYLVPVNLLAKLEIWDESPSLPKEEAFLDLEVLALPLEEIKELSFKAPNISWSLHLEGENYIFEKDSQKKKLSSEEGKNFLRRLFPLLAEGIVPPDQFQKPSATLNYLLRTGQKGQLFFQCQKENCLLKKGEFVFKVKKENLKDFFAPLSSNKTNG